MPTLCGSWDFLVQNIFSHLKVAWVGVSESDWIEAQGMSLFVSLCVFVCPLEP